MGEIIAKCKMKSEKWKIRKLKKTNNQKGGKMKKYFISLLAMSFLFVSLTGATIKREKDKVAVMPIQGKYAIKDELFNEVITAIVRTERFIVVERARMEEVFQEMKLSLTGTVSDKDIIQVGKLLSARTLIFGNITGYDVHWEKVKGGKGYYSSTIDLTIRFVDAEKGIVKEAATLTGHGKGKSKRAATINAIRSVSQNVVSSLQEMFPQKGSIIKKKGGEVYINVGKDDGVKKGTQFDVLSIKGDIIDPETGEVLGTEEKKVGAIEVTYVGTHFAKARILKGRYGIKKGYIVKERKTKSIISPSFSITLIQVSKDKINELYGGISKVTYFPIGWLSGSWENIGGSNAGFGLAIGAGGNGEGLTCLGFKGIGNYRLPIIPEYFWLYTNAYFGLVEISQTSEYLGDYWGYRKIKSSPHSIDGFAGISGMAKLRLLPKGILFAGVGYGLFESASEWKISVEVYPGADSTEEVTIPDSYVPHTDLNLTGPFIIGGISLYF